MAHNDRLRPPSRYRRYFAQLVPTLAVCLIYGLATRRQEDHKGRATPELETDATIQITFFIDTYDGTARIRTGRPTGRHARVRGDG